MEFIQYGVRFMLIVLFTFFLSLFVTSVFTVSVPLFDTQSRVFFTQVSSQVLAQYHTTGAVDLDAISIPELSSNLRGPDRVSFGAKITYGQSPIFDKDDTSFFADTSFRALTQERYFQQKFYDIYCTVQSGVSEQVYVKKTFVQPVGSALLTVTLCGLGDSSDDSY
jgi:hypothetical protein